MVAPRFERVWYRINRYSCPMKSGFGIAVGDGCRRLQLAEAEGDLHLRGESSSSYDEADWDVELLTEDDTGFVVFDGGSYSRGPLTLGALLHQIVFSPECPNFGRVADTDTAC